MGQAHGIILRLCFCLISSIVNSSLFYLFVTQTFKLFGPFAPFPPIMEDTMKDDLQAKLFEPFMTLCIFQ